MWASDPKPSKNNGRAYMYEPAPVVHAKAQKSPRRRTCRISAPFHERSSTRPGAAGGRLQSNRDVVCIIIRFLNGPPPDLVPRVVGVLNAGCC
jgi:hypothetical protein